MTTDILVTNIINNPDDFSKDEVIEALSTLNKEFEQYKKESIKWSKYDFLELEGYRMTEEQAQQALECMIRRHDASYGVTWETLDYYAELFGEVIDYADENN